MPITNELRATLSATCVTRSYRHNHIAIAAHLPFLYLLFQCGLLCEIWTDVECCKTWLLLKLPFDVIPSGYRLEAGASDEIIGSLSGRREQIGRGKLNGGGVPWD